jgi:hypothetical protein
MGCLDKLFIASMCLRRISHQKLSLEFLLSKKEGVVNEALIDLELKHLFKGKSGWTIKKLGEDEYLLDFPSEDLRNELTKFKGFEFATTIVKAKVDPIVCALEETWVKATGFPRKAKKESD